MKSNVYMMLEDFFNEPIIDIAKKMNYREDNILILEGDEFKLRELFPETYNNLISCTHHRDYRTPMQYAQDLVCSWIFEDYLMYNLNKCEINIELSGKDKNRQLLRSARVSASSDYIVSYKNQRAFIELANDYKGYWKRKRVCDLRDDKYNHIKRSSENVDFALLLGIDFQNGEFFIIDLEEDRNEITYSDYHRAYHKPAYSIQLKNVEFEKFTFENIADKIIEKMSV